MRDDEELWQWPRLDIRLTITMFNHTIKKIHYHHHHHHHHHHHQSIFSTFESIRVTLKVQVNFDFKVGCTKFQKWKSYKSGLLLIKANWTSRLKNFKVCLRGVHVFVNSKFHSSNKVLHFGYEISCCFMNSNCKWSICDYSICYVSKCCRKIINFFVILEQ